MKIVLVSGSYPPAVCGVGDYSKNLLEAGSEGVWSLYTSNNWRLASLPLHIRSITRMNPDAVVMQYPTQGYGWSLVPHLLGIYYSLRPRVKFAVALHEFSQLSLKARAALWMLMGFTQSAIFTSKYEADIAADTLSRLRSRSTVIPIKYNIEPVRHVHEMSLRTKDVCYFGQIRPNKGIEQFIDVCKRLLNDHPTLSVYIAGQVPEGYEPYLEAVRRSIEGTSIRIVENMPPDRVTELLNDCRVAYLPFPDGVSERRGSFLAAISNGLAVVAQAGSFSSPQLKAAFIEAGTDPCSSILEVLQSSEAQYSAIQSNGFRYLQAYVPSSWSEVARRYESFLSIA